MIVSNYSDCQTPQFKVLSEAQCHELYMATLECLSRVGVQVNNAEAIDLLGSAGATVREKRVTIPPHIIQDAVAAAPRAFTVWGRDGGKKMEVAPGKVHFGPGPTCTNYLDPQTGQRRIAQRGDAGLTAKACEALPQIDYVMGLALLDNVTSKLAPVYEFAEMMANTTKPVLAWAYNPETLSDIYRIAVAIAGSEAAWQWRPNFAYFATYKSPLQHAREDTGNILWAAEHGIPLVYLGGPTVGLESPVTGASGLVLFLAAALSGVAIVQLKRRGAPMVIGGLPSVMDLRTARPAYGSPETSLHCAAAAELAHYVGLPFMGTAGATESKGVDAQAAAEAALQVLMSALSGASLVHDVGFLDCADIGSLPYLVLADEIIAMTKRIMRGIPVNRDTIMLDLVEKVGPGGNFVAERESVNLSRGEIWVPTLMDRNSYTIWQQLGSPTIEQRINAKLHKILNAPGAAPLTPEVTSQIEAILTEAEERERRAASEGA
jgi:trimethylamine--corrinoid protein Co-methyltransferase